MGRMLNLYVLPNAPSIRRNWTLLVGQIIETLYLPGLIGVNALRKNPPVSAARTWRGGYVATAVSRVMPVGETSCVTLA